MGGGAEGQALGHVHSPDGKEVGSPPRHHEAIHRCRKSADTAVAGDAIGTDLDSHKPTIEPPTWPNLPPPFTKSRETEEIYSVRTYRVSGDAHASVMQWMTLDTENRPDIQIKIWIDAQTGMPAKAPMAGGIGQYDTVNTAAEIVISDISSQSIIDVPRNYVDVSGG